MVSERISVDPQALKGFCERNGIRKLSLFGSVLRDDFGPESDIDVLVEFQPDYRTGYFGIVRMEEELTALFGRKVDLRTPAELSKYFRDDVLRQAQLIYVQG